MPPMNLIPEKEEAISEICKCFQVKSLHIFGSFAEDSHHELSDIDFIVEFERSSFEGAFEQFMGLKEELEKALGRPVDLLTNTRFRNEIFREEVERSKRLIYAA